MPMTLEDYCNKDNWPTDLLASKEFARQAVTEWQWKKNAPKILAQIDRATTIARVQQLVIYPILSGEGLRVI